MTKKLLFMAMAALAVSSCTQVEVDEVATTPREPIRFEQFISKATRADDVTLENLEAFSVRGIIVKDGGEDNFYQTVRKSGDIWTYSGQIYWEEGATYYFVATNTGSNNNYYLTKTSADEYSLDISGFSNTSRNDMDMVMAICPEPIVGKASGNSTVLFNFKHAMAKVQLTFINGYDAGTDISIQNIKLAKVLARSTVSLQNGVSSSITWKKIDTQTTTRTFDNVDFIVPEESQTLSAFLVPQQIQDTDVQVQFNVEVTTGDQTLTATDITVPLLTDEVTEWLPGHVYNYKIRIKSKELIDFVIEEVEDWEETGDQELDDVETEARR